MRAKPFSALLAGVSCAVVVAGCGGSGHKPTASASAAYAFAKCMRAHGAPNFPDPRPSSEGGGFAFMVNSSGVVVVDGTSLNGPAFNAAKKSCSHLDSGVFPSPLTEAQKQGMVAKAQCIRRNGVPGFPDPTFGPGGYGAGVNLGAGLSPDSPAIRTAAKACADVGIGIPGTAT